MHWDDPRAEMLSPGHIEGVVAPGNAAKVPDAVAVHADAPAALYVPGGQSSAAVAPTVRTNEPAGLFMQAVGAVDPMSGLYFPAAQAVQATLPFAFLYVPAENDAWNASAAMSG